LRSHPFFEKLRYEAAHQSSCSDHWQPHDPPERKEFIKLFVDYFQLSDKTGDSLIVELFIHPAGMFGVFTHQ
jgi:hypothetical protein